MDEDCEEDMKAWFKKYNWSPDLIRKHQALKQKRIEEAALKLLKIGNVIPEKNIAQVPNQPHE